MRRDLPTGTVTFLFTDVERSTELLYRLGAERYAQALADHRRIVRAALGAHGGVEVGTQGDSFFIAFRSAAAALRTAAEALEGCAAGPIRVRMGIHTGTSYVADGDYVGVDVHRAARIAGCGHGGQVLVSAATVACVGADGLRDLGEHRLKDLSAPERIYQLGSHDFPPLKSLHQTNLPVPATPFLGRDREVAEVSALIARDDVRLVTLTGPGGSGKTRLALQTAAAAADAFEGGVWWVPLAPLRDRALVLEAAANVLGATSDLAEHIGDRSLLILFDNFEHVVEAAPDVARLLERCPGLTIVTTSREPLHLGGEWEYAVDPLRDAEATALFEARARAVRHDFVPSAEVREICARLDNLPLAIELAAARVKVLSPRALLERLDRRLGVLATTTRDAPERQRTLRTTIEWSHDLLTPEEQALFRHFGVFAGGATLAASEAVCGADLDTLASLVDKNLVRQAEDRFWMLETIREYAEEQLERAGEAEEVRLRHAEHYVALAEEAEPNLRGNPEQWLDRLELEHDNLRAAFDRLEACGESQLALRLVAALWRFWAMRGHLAEGRRRVEDALRVDERPTAARAAALGGAAVLAINTRDAAAGRTWANDALALQRALGDSWGIANAVFLLAGVEAEESNFERARDLFDEAAGRFEELGDQHYTLLATRQLAWSCYELGDRDRAHTLHEDVVRRARETGNRRLEASSLGALAEFAIHGGDLDVAVPMLYESTCIYRELGDRFWTAVNLCRFARALAVTGRAEAATRLLSRAEALRAETGAVMESWVTEANETLAVIHDQIDAAAFDDAWEQGEALTVDEALALGFESR